MRQDADTEQATVSMTLQGPSSAHEDVTVLSVAYITKDVFCVYIELMRAQKGHSVYITRCRNRRNDRLQYS
jgi:hypothetical protein